MKYIIVGNGEFAAMLYDYIKDSKEVVAFTVEDEYVNGATFCDKPVIAISKIKNMYGSADVNMLLGVGYSDMNKTKKKMFELYKKLGYKFVNYIHPTAIVADDIIVGEGNIILEGAIVQRKCVVGDANLIWEGCIISHDTVIGNFNQLSPGVVMAGKCNIGDRNFLGTNCTIINKIKIGNGVLVRAGAVVSKDMMD